MKTKIERIEKDGKYNIKDENGKILYENWFDEMYISETDYIKVKLNGKYNYINSDGKLISLIWFDNVREFTNNAAGVFIFNKGFNFINGQGDIISNIWFDFVIDFKDDVAKVKLKDTNTNINISGEQQAITVFEWLACDDYSKIINIATNTTLNINENINEPINNTDMYAYMTNLANKLVYSNLFKNSNRWALLTKNGDIIYSNNI